MAVEAGNGTWNPAGPRVLEQRELFHEHLQLLQVVGRADLCTCAPPVCPCGSASEAAPAADEAAHPSRRKREASIEHINWRAMIPAVAVLAHPVPTTDVKVFHACVTVSSAFFWFTLEYLLEMGVPYLGYVGFFLFSLLHVSTFAFFFSGYLVDHVTWHLFLSGVSAMVLVIVSLAVPFEIIWLVWLLWLPDWCGHAYMSAGPRHFWRFMLGVIVLHVAYVPACLFPSVDFAVLRPLVDGGPRTPAWWLLRPVVYLAARYFYLHMMDFATQCFPWPPTRLSIPRFSGVGAGLLSVVFLAGADSWQALVKDVVVDALAFGVPAYALTEHAQSSAGVLGRAVRAIAFHGGAHGPPGWTQMEYRALKRYALCTGGAAVGVALFCGGALAWGIDAFRGEKTRLTRSIMRHEWFSLLYLGVATAAQLAQCMALSVLLSRFLAMPSEGTKAIGASWPVIPQPAVRRSKTQMGLYIVLAQSLVATLPFYLAWTSFGLIT